MIRFIGTSITITINYDSSQSSRFLSFRDPRQLSSFSQLNQALHIQTGAIPQALAAQELRSLTTISRLVTHETTFYKSLSHKD
jgi:hypothetical protein